MLSESVGVLRIAVSVVNYDMLPCSLSSWNRYVSERSGEANGHIRIRVRKCIERRVLSLMFLLKADRLTEEDHENKFVLHQVIKQIKHSLISVKYISKKFVIISSHTVLWILNSK